MTAPSSARTPLGAAAERLTLDPGTPALVLRLAPNIFHHGTLGVIRSLGRAGVEVHALLEGPQVPAARSRHLHRAHRMPATVDPAQLLDHLHRIAVLIGRRTLIVPVDDVGALFVAEHADQLRECFLLPQQPPGLPRRLADKSRLIDVCRDIEVPHPATVHPRTLDDVASAVADLGLPLVAKWSRPWQDPPTPTRLLRSWDEAATVFALASTTAAGLLLQQLVPPATGSDWFFHGYFDADSRCRFAATGRKERAYPPQTGLTTLGRWLPNPALEELVAHLAARLGYRGILDLDFRRHPATGEYHLLDFNPRPGAQFRLFTDRRGLDVIRAEHLDLTGRDVPAVQPHHGRGFLVETYDPVSAALQVWGRTLPVRQVYRSLTGVGELAWWSVDDPRPALAAGSLWCAACFHRLRRREGWSGVPIR